MEWEQFFASFTNAGVSVGVIVYFMYRDYKFMDTLKTTLQTLVDTVEVLKDTIKEQDKE